MSVNINNNLRPLKKKIIIINRSHDTQVIKKEEIAKYKNPFTHRFVIIIMFMCIDWEIILRYKLGKMLAIEKTIK